MRARGKVILRGKRGCGRLAGRGSRGSGTAKISSSCLMEIAACLCVCVSGVKVQGALECSFTDHCVFGSHFYDA